MRSRRTGTALSGRVSPGAAEDGVTKSDNFIEPQKNERPLFFWLHHDIDSGSTTNSRGSTLLVAS